jgi:hypothetical protein
MKKSTIITLSILFIAIGAYYFFSGSERQEKWQTYNKVDHNKIESYPTTKKEVEKYNLPDLKKEPKKRSPAAVAPKTKKTKLERTIVNPLNKKLDPKTASHNKVHKLWKERLGLNLLRFLRPDTVVFVKKQKSVSLLERNKLRHAEVVIIQLKSPEGRRYSYNAYVDSESGKVLQTWNRTIHEFYGKKAKKLSPSGMINSEGSLQF